MIILTAAVVITGINTPENTEYAVKMHNKATLQDAVTLYVMTEMLNDIDNFVITSTGATKARDVADIVTDLYENGTWKDGANVKLGISMTLDELNTVFEVDDKAVVSFAEGQESTLDGTEGGNQSSSTTNQSSSNNNQSSSNNNQSSSNNNQSSSNNNQSSSNNNQQGGTQTPTGTLLTAGILDAVPESSISRLTAFNSTSAPFAYQDLDLFAGKTITTIGIPVKSVAAIDANQTFTVYVIKNNTTAFNTAAYEDTITLKLPVDQLGSSTTVNKWIFVDCNIPLEADETLAFWNGSDTVKPGYKNSAVSGYDFSFYTYVGKTNNSSKLNVVLPFAVYAAE